MLLPWEAPQKESIFHCRWPVRCCVGWAPQHPASCQQGPGAGQPPVRQPKRQLLIHVLTSFRNLQLLFNFAYQLLKLFKRECNFHALSALRSDFPLAGPIALWPLCFKRSVCIKHASSSSFTVYFCYTHFYFLFMSCRFLGNFLKTRMNIKVCCSLKYFTAFDILEKLHKMFDVSNIVMILIVIILKHICCFL